MACGVVVSRGAYIQDAPLFKMSRSYFFVRYKLFFSPFPSLRSPQSFCSAS